MTDCLVYIERDNKEEGGDDVNRRGIILFYIRLLGKGRIVYNTRYKRQRMDDRNEQQDATTRCCCFNDNTWLVSGIG